MDGVCWVCCLVGGDYVVVGYGLVGLFGVVVGVCDVL